MFELFLFLCWISVRFSTFFWLLLSLVFLPRAFDSFSSHAFSCLSRKVNGCCSFPLFIYLFIFFCSVFRVHVCIHEYGGRPRCFPQSKPIKKEYICLHNKPIVVNCSKVNQQNCSVLFNEKCVRMLIYMLVVKYINLLRDCKQY